jgi:AraC family transcriptional regulator
MDPTMTTTLTNACGANGPAIFPDNGTSEKPECRVVAPIAPEECWRSPVLPKVKPAMSTDRVSVSRWTRRGVEDIEHTSQSTLDHHTVGISLKTAKITFRSGGMLYEGQITPGATQVTGLGQSATVVFHSPCDVLHLYVPRQLLVQHYQDAFGCQHADDIHMGARHITCDPTIGRLGLALSRVQGNQTFFGDMYVESVSTAIVARLLDRSFSNNSTPSPRKTVALSPWRLRRAIDYMETHLAEPLTLSGIAGSVGLTRMHFAAQFRLATGSTPHTYLLRRRVERAQWLLLESDQPVTQIALDCGFSTPSHFSEVFKRLVGNSPKLWRTHGRHRR